MRKELIGLVALVLMLFLVVHSHPHTLYSGEDTPAIHTGVWDQSTFSHIMQETINQTVEDTPPVVGLYYYNLVKNKGYGFHEQQDFTPASLLKVPILMGVYKLADQDPSLLKTPITIPEEDRNQVYRQNIPPEKHVQVGQTYTIEELLTYMAQYSDNIAYQAVGTYIESSNLLPSFTIYTDFGLSTEKLSGKGDIISSKELSQFFIKLYQKSYLSPQSSDKVLHLLTQSEFSNGLITGVPSGTRVAHKFGERGYTDSKTRELHDCGIIYHAKSPFVLCIMTKGHDVSQQEMIMAILTKTIYSAVDQGQL